MSTIKTVAVIGATGMLGAPVAKQLVQDGFNVRVVSRDISTAKNLFTGLTHGGHISYAQADLGHSGQLKAALNGVDAIYINLSGNSPRTYYVNHVTGTQQILAAADHANIQLVSMISMASAYSENSFRADTNAKLQAEALIKQSGLDYLIFMPSWFMETLPLFVQKGKVMQIGKSSQPVRWQTAKDYACIVSESIQAGVFNQRIAVVGPKALSIDNALDLFAKHQGHPIQKMPIWLAKLIARLTQDDGFYDVADLLQYYEKVGEITREKNKVITTTTFEQWLKEFSK